MKNYSEDFAELLSRFQTRAGLTQQALADEVGVHRNTIVKLANRTSRPTSRGFVLRLADALILTKNERKELLEAAHFSIARWPIEVWFVPYGRDPFFVGREDVLLSLRGLLEPGNMAALTQAISGLGGIGKTHVAVEYAYRFQKDYEAVFWLQANSWETLIAECIKLAAELGMSEQEKTEDILTDIRRWLQKHYHWLLILDNVEDPQEILRKFAPAGHHGSVLITTRVKDVEPLARTQILSIMPEHESVLFLLRRAKIIALDAGFESADKAQYDDAWQIWQLMGGLPLALDQAGAYILETGCSFASYQERYTHRRAELLRRRGKRFIGHEASVATTFSLAFERFKSLNSDTTVLQICSLLYGESIPEEIFENAEKLLGLPLTQGRNLDEMFGLLQDLSLVQRNPEGKMLSIHRLVQAVLQDEMEEEDRRYWAIQSIQLVSTIFPEVKPDTWLQCERLLLQAFACVSLIKQMQLITVEGEHLLNQAAIYLDVHGRYEEAKPLYQQALAVSEQLWGASHLNVAGSLNNLAMLYLAQGNYTQAEPLFKRALMMRKKQLGLMHPDTALSLNNLAGLYDALGKYREAESLLKQSLEICEKLLGPMHPDTAATISNIAYLYDRQDKYEKAEPLYQRALAIREQQLGSMHPDTALSLNNLAGLYDAKREYEKAEPLYQRALAIREQQFESPHPAIAESLNNLGLLYHHQEKYKQARPLFERASAMSEQLLGPEHPDVAISLGNLAMLYEDEGELLRAEPLLKRVLTIRERQLGPVHPATAQSLNNLAIFYARQGHYTQAEPLLKRALSICKQELGSGNPLTRKINESYREVLRQVQQL